MDRVGLEAEKEQTNIQVWWYEAKHLWCSTKNKQTNKSNTKLWECSGEK